MSPPTDAHALLKAQDILRSINGVGMRVPGGSFKQVVLLANEVAAEENAALILLLDGSFDRAAVVHARGLFELRVSVEFIASGGLVYLEGLPANHLLLDQGEFQAEVDRRSEAFLMYSVYWLSQRATSLSLLDIDEAVHQHAKTVDDKFGYTKNGRRWWPKTLREMASEIGQNMRYDLVYRLGSDLIHHGSHALLRYAMPPTLDWMDRELAIWSAANDLEYLLLQLESEFSLKLSEQIEELARLRRDLDVQLNGA